VALLLLVSFAVMSITDVALAAGTAYGEIQNRPAPVYRTPSPSLPCTDPNVFNITVAVHFNASAAQLTNIENLISAGSAVLFDVTDGQAEIGEAFIYNDAFGTAADLRIYPSTSDTWWWANTGQYKVGGSAHVSYNYITAADAGEALAHELSHLIFDPRDEYESRDAACINWLAWADCPDAAMQAALGEDPCLMDGGGTEYCWGHANPADPTDLSGGNHDADLVTEQSRCRSNRSCWDQLVWSWPDHFTMPAAAPDPAAMGAVVAPSHFVIADATVRVVLVLDESGSMILESPSRMQRLKVAANDFVTLAESGTELGIVSFSTDAEPASGHASVPIAPLGAVRTTWTNAINGLTPGGWTNIGDGLQKARDMISPPGGVTANTFIVLMTDGVNNRPLPDPAGHLTGVLATLLADGIPVYVTCTGGDFGLSSQCSEIATATGGFYVDSADAADLPEAFADFHEKISGREALDSASGPLSEAKATKVFVDQGSESVTFTLMWQDEKAAATMTIIDPAGGQQPTLPMAQGRYARFTKPMTGDWEMVIDPRGDVQGDYVARAYTRNQIQSLTAAVRYPVVLPGDPIYVYAYPRSLGGGITHPDERIIGTVLLPNGEKDSFELHDRGLDAGGEGDDLPEDGTFTGVYTNTKLEGPYRFLLRADIEKWSQSTDRSKYDPDLRSPRFVREVRLSAAVGEPRPPRTIESITRQPKAVRIIWHSIADVKYTVNFSNDPKDRGKPISTVDGTGGLVEWTDDGSETGTDPDDPRVLRRFYRLSTDR